MSKTKFILEDLFNLRGAVIYNPDDYKPTQFVSIDSRAMRKGAIFVAIKGKRFDGHNFVRDAIKNGAGAVIISSRKLNDFDDVEIPIVTVPNTIKAYGELANVKRNKINYLTIGITGSNGKTTTKDLTAILLSEKFKTAKTEANNNNHIGVPLTILSAKPSDEALVLELGTNHFGEIEYIANIAEPDIALITNIGNAHSKYLKNKKGVLAEKRVLFDVAERRNGKILVNIDDALLRKLSDKYRGAITFGFDESAEIKGEIIGKDKNGFPKLRAIYGKRKLEVKIPLAGKANLLSAFNAIAIAFVAGLSNKEIKSGAKKFEQTKGRFEIIRLKDFTIINDTYNASPESMKISIESLGEFDASKKIAVLGDMLELGEDAEKQHKALAKVLRKAKIDEVLLFGKNMKTLKDEKKLNVSHFAKMDTLIKRLKQSDLRNSVIIVKGSRGMKMERVVKFLTENYD